MEAQSIETNSVQQTTQNVPSQPPVITNPTTSQLCKMCCTSKYTKFVVSISSITLSIILLGITGILCPYFLVTMNVRNRFAPFLFSIYTAIFSITLIFVELKVKFVGNIFLFLLSYTYRALFIMFLGTLTMAAFQVIPGREWIGYLVGLITICFGILHIVIGCLDRDWKRHQSMKYKEQALAQGWKTSPVPSAAVDPTKPLESAVTEGGVLSSASSQQPMQSSSSSEPPPPASHQPIIPPIVQASASTIATTASTVGQKALINAYDKIFEDEN